MPLSAVGEEMEELWVKLFNSWVLSSGAPTSPRGLGSHDLVVISLLPSTRKGDVGSACGEWWGLGRSEEGKVRFFPHRTPVVAQACL